MQTFISAHNIVHVRQVTCLIPHTPQTFCRANTCHGWSVGQKGLTTYLTCFCFVVVAAVGFVVAIAVAVCPWPKMHCVGIFTFVPPLCG